MTKKGTINLLDKESQKYFKRLNSGSFSLKDLEYLQELLKRLSNMVRVQIKRKKRTGGKNGIRKRTKG